MDAAGRFHLTQEEERKNEAIINDCHLRFLATLALRDVSEGNTCHFGYKGHIGVDKDSGLVRHVEVTAAYWTSTLIRFLSISFPHNPFTFNG